MKSYYLNRIEKLRRLLKEGEAIVIETPEDLFYLTGLTMSQGIVLITPRTAVLIVDGRYIGAAKAASPIDVALLDDDVFKPLTSEVHTIFFDASKTTVGALKKWKEKLAGKKFEGVDAPVLALRAEKDESEIALLRASAELLMKGFQHVASHLKEGVTEKEMALEFEMFCRKEGAERLSFAPIVAFGEKGAYPHYQPSNNTLKKGDAVLLDMGVMLEGYASDMTRTFCFEGSFAPRMQTFFDVTAKAKQAALDLCKAGVEIAELDKAARAVMAEHGLEAFYPHSLGHGVGLEVHEQPRLSYRVKGQLKENMVITIEPGLYEPGVGGVRLEDTVVVTKTGHINFFESLSL